MRKEAEQNHHELHYNAQVPNLNPKPNAQSQGISNGVAGNDYKQHDTSADMDGVDTENNDKLNSSRVKYTESTQIKSRNNKSVYPQGKNFQDAHAKNQGLKSSQLDFSENDIREVFS